MDLLKNNTSRLSKHLVYTIAVLCFLPIVLYSFGVDFSTKIDPIDHLNSSTISLDKLVDILAGAFVHVILEWSAVMIGTFTAFFTYIQYKISGKPATIIIGVTLFCGGIMDAFHALAATHLIQSVSDHQNFIPFTWALSRMYNVTILLIGSLIFLIKNPKKLIEISRSKFVYVISLGFLLISYLTIHICAVSDQLPQTLFPNQFIKRPFDLAPLLIILILTIWVLPKLYKSQNNLFSQSLLLSMLPATLTQIHMAFGSSFLFDAHFNIAHFLKTISYLVPLLGLGADYIQTYRQGLERTRQLIKYQTRLESANKELEQFVYIAAHDLQEPLRTIKMYIDLLKKRYKEKMDEVGHKSLLFLSESADRLSNLVYGLLDYGRIGKIQEFTHINCQVIVQEIKADLSKILNQSKTRLTFKNLPVVMGNETSIRLLFQNLINNAIKYRDKNRPPIINIKVDENEENYIFSVSDNGIGIDPIHHEKIFHIFQKLHPKSQYEGAGIGLSHCKKIVQQHHGRIWVKSEMGQGSTFYFTIPKENEE